MRDARAVTLVVSGALAMGYAVAALFFAKFWRRTKTPLFAWFSAAFVLLAVQRLALVLVAPAGSALAVWSYLLRLVAFALILLGIAGQNRRATLVSGAPASDAPAGDATPSGRRGA